MKKIMFIYFFILLLLQGKTQQQYQSFFGDEATQWTITNKFMIPEESWMDTISVVAIENEYRILEFQSRWSTNNQIIGKIRANENNSKLYFIEQDSTSELLIMDLDLAVGDSFNIKIEYYLDRTIYVDSVYIFNGKKHIRFNDWIGTATPPGSSKRIFIEGVGANYGFEYGLNYLIVCKYDDFVQSYYFENAYIKDCKFLTSNIDNYQKKENIEIYPNPTYNHVVINISETSIEKTHLSVYNALGMEVLNKILSNSETTLDLSGFSKGLYYFKFQTQNSIIVKKIMKL